MGYIYKITNDINDKIYIGQTVNNLSIRFSQHKNRLKEYIEKNFTNQPLYNSMKKYGISHFFIELIEECSNEELDIREKYWIAQYNTYYNGYNATIGGEGVTKYDYDKIYQRLISDDKLTCTQIAKEFNCCLQTISNVAHTYGIDLNKRMSLQKKEQAHTNKNLSNNSKIVNQYDLNGNFIQSFSSIKEAGRWLVKEKNVNFDSATTAISRACNHPEKSKTAYKYIWKFA